MSPRCRSRVPAVLAVGVALCLAGPPGRSSSAVAQMEHQDQYEEPVRGEVVDRFRPPAHIGAPGNRGWEYRTTPGSAVTAAADGIVAFAGPIGGRLHVSINHPGGIRTTYSLLATVTVTRGQAITQGAQVGSAGPVFHFGARRRGSYIDPASLFLPIAPGRVHLVPLSGVLQ